MPAEQRSFGVASSEAPEGRSQQGRLKLKPEGRSQQGSCSEKKCRKRIRGYMRNEVLAWRTSGPLRRRVAAVLLQVVDAFPAHLQQCFVDLIVVLIIKAKQSSHGGDDVLRERPGEHGEEFLE
jgi:hypothetical protein